MKLNLGCGGRKRDGWVNVDVDKSCNPDVLADAHKLPFEDNSVEEIVGLSLLEHVQKPQEVINECHRVLEPRGIITMRVPFIWPYHGSPDFWRFTEDGLQYLFRRFRNVAIKQEYGFFDTIPTLYKQGWLRRMTKWLDKKFKSKTCTLYWVTATK